MPVTYVWSSQGQFNETLIQDVMYSSVLNVVIKYYKKKN